MQLLGGPCWPAHWQRAAALPATPRSAFYKHSVYVAGEMYSAPSIVLQVSGGPGRSGWRLRFGRCRLPLPLLQGGAGSPGWLLTCCAAAPAHRLPAPAVSPPRRRGQGL